MNLYNDGGWLSFLKPASVKLMRQIKTNWQKPKLAKTMQPEWEMKAGLELVGQARKDKWSIEAGFNWRNARIHANWMTQPINVIKLKLKFQLN